MKRLDPSSLTEFGHHLESFVVQEAIRQATWMDAPVSAGITYYVGGTGYEVDDRIQVLQSERLWT
jgi:predicted AAA+ superfamily ATPase